LESQNEKIGDLNRELALSRMPSSNLMFNSGVNKKGTETNCEEMIELRGELAQARLEVDRLLKMMQSGEREKAQLLIQCKQLQNNLLQQDGSTSISARSTTEPGNYRSRVEELEEALRESVSITAERELHLAQQKQLNLQLNHQLMESRREMGELRSTTTNMGDKEALIRGMDTERRQHLDQLFQLKQEALMAAIGEKEAHIELLESARGERNENELDALRRHKLALMHKLQEENERRAQLQQQGTHHNSDVFRSTTTTTTSNVNRPGPSSSSILTTSGMAQDDDADGIWA